MDTRLSIGADRLQAAVNRMECLDVSVLTGITDNILLYSLKIDFLWTSLWYTGSEIVI